jgi:hypothetical protein
LLSVVVIKLATNGSFDRKEHEEIISGLNLKKQGLDIMKNLHALFG